MASRFAAAVDALEQALHQSHNLRTWLRARRWCGESIGLRSELAVKDRAELADSATEAIVLFLAVVKEENVSTPIHLPLAVSTAKQDAEAFELPVGRDRMYVTEAERRDSYAQFVLEGFHGRPAVRTRTGDTLLFTGEDMGAFRSAIPATEDSSNLVTRIESTRGLIAFKTYKLLDPGNREPDILERLRKKDFRQTPRFFGEMALGKGADRLVLGVATEHAGTMDAFSWFTESWREELGDAPRADFERMSLGVAGTLGEATALLHEALLDRHPGPFQAEAFTAEDSEAATKAALTNLSDSLRRLAALAKGSDASTSKLAAEARTLVFTARDRIERTLSGIEATVGTPKAVTHADLHLGQVLRRDTGDFMFIDFEGEPERPSLERSRKLPPLRDVATMDRSFSYVKHYAWREATRGDATAAWRLLHRQDWSPDQELVARRLQAWESAAVERYGRAYLEKSTVYESVDPSQALHAIRGWALEKALYEFRYELKHRPQNIFIPLEGVMSLAQ